MNINSLENLIQQTLNNRALANTQQQRSQIEIASTIGSSRTQQPQTIPSLRNTQTVSTNITPVTNKPRSATVLPSDDRYNFSIYV